jgi:uncharacterized membrane protein YgcG
MKRLQASILAVATLLGSLIALPVSADVNDFDFRSFEADYYLSRNEQNRSTLRTREKLVAEFPNFDQNHGIERAIPQEYDGHPVNLRISSVKNGQGNDLRYTTYTSNKNLVLRIGDADRYVHGLQTYVIEYTAQDVTKEFNNGDEFYWDVNGTGWSQTFDTVSARIHLDQTIADRFDNRHKCYTGAQGSTATDCTIEAKTSPETVITANARSLGSGENLTVVAGFQANTFSQYVAPPTPWWVIVGGVLLILLGIIWYLIVPIVAFVRAYKLWRLHGRDAPGRGTIIPQYSPPQGVTVLGSDVIINDRMSPGAVSAAIIDLAIRGYLKIYEQDKKKYELELVKLPDDLSAEEREVVNILFGSSPVANTKITLNDKEGLYEKVAKLGKSVYKQAITDGHMIDTQALQRKMNTWGIVLTVLSALTFNVLGFLAGLIITGLAYHMPARSAKGVELKEYLLGTRDYMKLAEADRMKVLQSVQGAERIDTSDGQQMVKLYEKLLPLAMLFGVEKSWTKQFAGLYQQPPDWYAGNWTTFNAAVFASSVGNFGTTTAASNFSPPASSGSSGFSGGGSSGGGGGGGGGGGW